MTSITDIFIADVTAFLARHKWGETRLGRLAVNNPSFVNRLKRRPGAVAVRTIERVRKFMDEYNEATRKAHDRAAKAKPKGRKNPSRHVGKHRKGQHTRR